jgi:hypothetical protein
MCCVCRVFGTHVYEMLLLSFDRKAVPTQRRARVSECALERVFWLC